MRNDPMNFEENFFDPSRIVRKTGKAVVVPEGVYLCKIEKSLTKEKDGNRGLMVGFSILAPSEQRGRSLMEYFNLKHSSKAAQEMGEQKLCAMLDSMGLGTKPLKTEYELQNCTVKMRVGQKPHYKNADEMQNYVIGYDPVTAKDEKLLRDVQTMPSGSDVPF